MLTDEHGPPVLRACRIARFSRTAYYRAPALAAAPGASDAATVDAPIIDALGTVVEKHGRWG
jgi:hypothetical protein